MADLRNFLLEIGVEEMPSRFMAPTLAQLAERSRKELAGNRLEFKGLRTFGTPRRLVLVIEGLSPRQDELRETVRGPAASVAFDSEGRPTRAAEGFARSQGAAVSDLKVEELGGGRYVVFQRVTSGRDTSAVLSDLVPGLILSLDFPKTMRWGRGELRFARPIHWVVALLDGEVVPLSVGDVQSGRRTEGIRFLARGPHEIPHLQDYERVLAAAYVIPDNEVRSNLIRDRIMEVAGAAGGRVLLDEGLLEEVTHLVEYPTPFVGTFAADYLELPREVLMTSMRKHQRYFPVVDDDDRLLPMFVAVKNGPPTDMDLIRAGNEKVIRARLADAKFFFDEDRRQPLEDYVAGTREMVFQEELGTLYDKTERIRRVGAALAMWAGLDAQETQALDRALYLCKADLLTQMVYEFPEVEGIMGREYARLSGEDEAVAIAIHEHYLPKHSGDRLPATRIGRLASLADKADTITGCFAIGLRPTGSQDPYGLRRLALGIMQVLGRWDSGIQLSRLLSTALEGHRPEIIKADREAILKELRDFFAARLKVLMQDEGIRYDVVDAVVAAGADDVHDAWVRAGELTRVLAQPEFAAVTVAHRRARNLGQRAESVNVREELLGEPAERDLHQAYVDVQSRAGAFLAEKRYKDFFAAAQTLKEPLDTFLDQVMVMVDDEEVRKNRLALLRAVAELLARPADLEKLVV